MLGPPLFSFSQSPSGISGANLFLSAKDAMPQVVIRIFILAVETKVL
jgi:hypothetical protein